VGGEADSARDIARRVEENLARFGIAGNVDVVSDVATLHGNGPTVSTAVGALVVDWPDLAEDARARRASELARRLSSERRTTASLSPHRRRRFPAWLRRAALVTGALLAAVAALRMYQLVVARGVEAALVRREAAGDDRDVKEREARKARVCEATRSRVMRGAAVGASDAEGFIVELWALRAPERGNPASDPVLAEFVTGETPTARGRVVWTGAPSLASLDGEDTSVTVTEANVPADGTPAYRGVRVSFRGRLSTPYFEDGPRRDYVRMARALTDALGTDHAALYAHCTDSAAHHLGSWFRGPTPGGAVTSLLYFMGVFGERPDLRKSVLVPEGGTATDLGYAFQRVSSVASPLKKARVMTFLAAESGMIAGTDGTVSTITFPFRDSNRASRAEHGIARELGLDDPR
jgi:hypothetical protein